jgi:hypothetical protein
MTRNCVLIRCPELGLQRSAWISFTPSAPPAVEVFARGANPVCFVGPGFSPAAGTLHQSGFSR